ncbi:MAG: carboxypeptidase regulatory-like domain-containing protein [Myxococcales bacterium]|nr:carboxypeptidase regulatory-like domain-containing protein [Myxococcales bacterium]
MTWALPPGAYVVVAESDSLARQVVELQLAAGERRSLELLLATGHALNGLVLDERSREPLAAATVTVRSSARAPAQAASSDSRGRFRLKGLPAGRVVLDAAAPGFAGRSVLARMPDPSTITIGLTSAAWLSGRVVGGSTGEPVRVIAVGAADGEVREVSAGPSGAFSLEVPTGRYSVTARALKSVSNAVYATVLPGETAAGLELQLGPGAWIRGTVRLRDSREPIAAATVLLSVVERDVRILESISDSKGAFAIGPIAGGTYDVSAHVDGLRPVLVRALEVPARAVIERDLFVAPGATVTVVVRRDDGKAVAGALVSVAYSGFVADSTLPAGLTNEAGEVPLTGLPAGSLMLLVQAPDRGLATREPVDVPSSGAIRRVITLPERPAVLRGQVSGGTRPLGAGPIVLKFRRDNPGTWGERVAGTDGRFVLELPRGVWRLSASQGERKAATVTVDLTQSPDSIELTLLDPPVRPRACVRDLAQRPVPGARVFYRAESARGMTTTDGTGCAQLGPFDDAVVSVSAELESMRGSSSLRGNEDVVVMLHPGGLVTGNVFGDVPVNSFELELPTEPDMQPSGISRTIVGASFAVEVPAGSWVISARSDDGREATARVDVRSEHETRVELHFRPAQPAEDARGP